MSDDVGDRVSCKGSRLPEPTLIPPIVAAIDGSVAEPPLPSSHVGVTLLAPASGAERVADQPLLESVAAVDLGSNSFHMIVAQLIGGELRTVDRLREMVRLAAGLSGDNQLSEEAQQRAIACLSRFGQRLRGMPLDRVRVVGTNTLRKARNAQQFIAEAAVALGHPIEIIAGREEARLIYLGVSQSLPESIGQHLVVDIGGGSTEIIIGHRAESIYRESLYMGCVSYSQAHFPNGKVNANSMARAIMAARLELEPFESRYRALGWRDAVGASGTIKAISEVVQQSGWSDDGITIEALRQLADALVAAGHVNKLQLAGLKDERRPVFAGGVAVLLAIFESLSIDRMQVSDWALREGLLFDLVGRIRHEDVRERTIATMSERFDVDRAQARRVSDTALAALAQVANAWDLHDEEARYQLGWAAQLHEIGLAVAHTQHHKHAAYLLENSDMPGFSQQEQRRLALLVRSHRRKFPIGLFRSLPAATALRYQRLALLLRLAVALYRGRSDNPLPELTLLPNEQGVTLQLSAQWLDQHPLTAADLAVESGYLKAAKLDLHISAV